MSHKMSYVFYKINIICCARKKLWEIYLYGSINYCTTVFYKWPGSLIHYKSFLTWKGPKAPF